MLFSIVTLATYILVQILVLFLLAFVIHLLQKNQTIKRIIKIHPLDVWPPFLIYFIYDLSGHFLNESLIPHVIFVWMLVALISTIWQILNDHKLTYGRFFLRFWRMSDLVLFVAWISVVFFVCFTVK